jgi:hypothetical protein
MWVGPERGAGLVTRDGKDVSSARKGKRVKKGEPRM